MCDKNDGHATFPAEALDEVEEGLGRRVVEVRRRLIGEEKARRVDDRSRERNALAFPAAQLPGPVVTASIEPDPRKCVAGKPARFTTVHPGEDERYAHVALRIESANEVKRLKDEADDLATVERAFPRRQITERAPIDEDRTCGRSVESPDQVEKRRLPRAAHADDAEKLSRRHVEIDRAQSMDHFIAHAVNARQAADLDLGARCEKSHWAERNLTRWEPPAARSRTGPRRFLSEHLQSAAGTVGSSDRRMTREMTRPRILLTNDDGIDAPGLAALLGACEELGACRIIAPNGPRSGISHALTVHRPIRVERRDEERWALDGTPADCARLGLTHIATETEWVIAGINHGGNLGADFYPSGTVAAAREAAFLGCRAIAISQYVRRDAALDWKGAMGRAKKVLALLLERPLPAGHYWNVNLPHPDDDDADAEVVFCELDPSPLDVIFHETEDGFLYAGSYFSRPRVPGRDVDVCFGGKIAVSLLPLDIHGSRKNGASA